MQNRFTVNGVSYIAKPFDFAMVCDLESVGVSLSNADTMGMSFIRGYFAVCADISKEEAARRIQDHMINGGKLEDIANAMSKEMNDSDFFRALSKKEEQTTSEVEGEKKRGRKPSTENPTE